jgi:hypothetical protein
MGGADFIEPDANLDIYMEKLLATKNKGFRRKMEAQEKAFVAQTKYANEEEMDHIINNEKFKEDLEEVKRLN